MSDSRILGQMSKSGVWSKYHRRFHSLTRDAKQKFLDLIKSGTDIEKALRIARKTA